MRKIEITDFEMKGSDCSCPACGQEKCDCSSDEKHAAVAEAIEQADRAWKGE